MEREEWNGERRYNEARKGQRVLVPLPWRWCSASAKPRRSQPILPSFFFCLRGGVTGRPMFIPPYGYFAFFSAGFKIYPHRTVRMTRTQVKRDAPGKNITKSHPHSSLLRHCRTLHSNLAQKTVLQAAALQRIRTHPRRPVGRVSGLRP
jgi:hypothetical protein